jgi:hypothetical protein
LFANTEKMLIFISLLKQFLLHSYHRLSQLQITFVHHLLNHVIIGDLKSDQFTLNQYTIKAA